MEQLSAYFAPTHYDIQLNINKHTEKVFGHVIITGTQLDTKIIKLHAKNLKITALKLNQTFTDFTEQGDTVIISHPLDTHKPDIIIDITYTFTLNHNMEGAYLSTYQYEGKEERLVTTQFESHYARQCFPCIDEPAAKATFTLKIITPDIDDTVISNMPVDTERIVEYETVDANLELGAHATKKLITFQETPRMSTYLLAFCMGRFRQKTATSQHGVKITTYCTLQHTTRSLSFANQIAAEALDYYDDLFGIQYPLPKLDQIAIPDFEAGAMENWGLVTYRESCLLADSHTSQSTKEYIATVIAHELSHQWFGNLVTMKWWDNLWLNESFASVMQYMSIDDLHPEYKIWQDFFTGDCFVALHRDALPGVQAVQQPVHNPEEIATLFDGAIVYAKGAHLIFMLIRLMGKRDFFRGVQSYFKTHKYANTTGDDLWAALQQHAKFNVKEFMDAWISQPGYPVITDGYQQRFLLNGGTDDTKWPLPNITDDMSGHYLINLSGPEFTAALKDFTNLSLEQRLRLLIDRELLSKTTMVSSASLMDLLPEFADEQNEPTWQIIATIINDLKLFCPPETEYGRKYQAFVAQLIAPQLKRLGVRARVKEDSNDQKLRPTILAFALYTEKPQLVTRIAKLYREDYSKINPELRFAAFDAQLKESHEAIFDQLVEIYSATAEPSIKADLLSAFTNARLPQHTAKLLALLEQPSVVRPQDHIYLFANLLSNYKTRPQTFQWLYTHWDYIKDITGDKSLDDYLRVAASRVRTSEQADTFFDFADPLANDPAFTRSVAVAHTDINARLRWIAEDQAAVRSRL